MIAVVHVFVIVKTVLPDAPPVYPDGADLPQTTAKNVNLIRRYFKIPYIIFNTQNDTFDTNSFSPIFIA